MQTATTLDDALAFPDHRSMVQAVIVLKNVGEIDGYSIHKHPSGGIAAGVCVGETWGYLARIN